jgi:hypothetical protein
MPRVRTHFCEPTEEFRANNPDKVVEKDGRYYFRKFSFCNACMSARRDDERAQDLANLAARESSAAVGAATTTSSAIFDGPGVQIGYMNTDRTKISQLIHARNIVTMGPVISEEDAKALLEDDVFKVPLSEEDAEGDGWSSFFGLRAFGIDPKTGEERYAQSCEDSKRWMKNIGRLTRHARAREVIEKIKTKLLAEKILNELHTSHEAGVLLAFEGAPGQDRHRDYHRSRIFWELIDGWKLRGALSCLVALEEGTTVTDKNGREISIPKYHAALWRGDVRHSGSAYAVNNRRLHIYFNVKGCEPPHDHGYRAVAGGDSDTDAPLSDDDPYYDPPPPPTVRRVRGKNPLKSVGWGGSRPL